MAHLSKRARQIYTLAAAKRHRRNRIWSLMLIQVFEAGFMMKVKKDLGIQNRFGDFYQLLEQIEDAEENELDDDCDITESEDDFDLEEAQDAFAKIMGKDNAGFQLAKFKYQQGQEYSKIGK
jgi:hypothetical protein